MFSKYSKIQFASLQRHSQFIILSVPTKATLKHKCKLDCTLSSGIFTFSKTRKKKFMHLGIILMEFVMRPRMNEKIGNLCKSSLHHHGKVENFLPGIELLEKLLKWTNMPRFLFNILNFVSKIRVGKFSISVQNSKGPEIFNVDP